MPNYIDADKLLSELYQKSYKIEARIREIEGLEGLHSPEKTGAIAIAKAQLWAVSVVCAAVQASLVEAVPA